MQLILDSLSIFSGPNQQIRDIIRFAHSLGVHTFLLHLSTWDSLWVTAICLHYSDK